MTVDEAEALLAGDPQACVRARVSQNGEIALDSDSLSGRRKMMVAAGASMGLLAAACQTAGNFPPKGVIAGKVEAFNSSTVTATGMNGRIFRTKVRSDGSYAFKPVPYGSYALKFHGLCESWEGGTVEVRAGEVTAPTPPEPLNDCIIIGQIELEGRSSRTG